MLRIWLAISMLAVVSTVACANTQDGKPPAPEMTSQPNTKDGSMEIATLAGGCFWCIEAVFQRLEGVESVQSGYSGGSKETADYKTVSAGTTKHAEACQITFDPAVITYDEILQVFFGAHDPTTLNRQGNDIGPQYRSAIFYHTAEQKQIAEAYIVQLDQAGTWPDPIVTELTEFDAFYVAEDYPQNY